MDINVSSQFQFHSYEALIGHVPLQTVTEGWKMRVNGDNSYKAGCPFDSLDDCLCRQKDL